MVQDRRKCSTRLRSSERTAVPQALCGTLINALKLPANQQERWTWPYTEYRDQASEKGAGRVSRRSLRNFIQVDNHRALEVGHLRGGLGSFKVRRPKGEEGNPEVPVRESPEETDASERMKWALGSRVSMSIILLRRGGVRLW